MLEYLRKHTIVIMAAMVLVFVGLMFIGGDVGGGSLDSLFKHTYVSVGDESFGEKDYTTNGQMGLTTATYFQSSFAPLLQDYFNSDESVSKLCSLLHTSNPNAAFLVYRGIIRLEAKRLGLVPDMEEVDAAIRNMPEFLDANKQFDAKSYDYFIGSNGESGRKVQESILRGLMQDTLSLIRIKEVMLGGICVNPAFAVAVAESENQQITVNTAFFNREEFRPKTEPGEQEIKDYWEKHKENYKSDEARFFTVYTFTPQGDLTTAANGGVANATQETINLVETKIWDVLEGLQTQSLQQIIDQALAGSPEVCTVNAQSYKAVTRANAGQDLQLPINQQYSDGRAAHLLEVIFALPKAPTVALDIPEQELAALKGKVRPEQISTVQTLENGTVVIVCLDAITPVGTLPYESARNAARADLLDSLTDNALNTTASELTKQLEQDDKPLENFQEKAKQVGAHAASYGPFINPRALLQKLQATAATTPEMFAAQMEQLLNSPLAPSKDLREPESVFSSAAGINPGQTAPPIDTGDGLLVVQLVKRELQDTPEYQSLITQRIAPVLGAQIGDMILWDWLKACIAQYEVYIDPVLNQSR